MATKKTFLICSLMLILLTAGMTDAAYKGRLIGKIVDPEGNPIEGVTVKATSDDVPGFNEMDSEGQMHHLAPRLAQTDARVGGLLGAARGDKKAFQKLLRVVFGHWLAGSVADSGLQSWPEFQAEVLRALERVRQAQGSGTTSIVFTSGGVIATLVARVLGLPDTAVYSVYEPVINCSITRPLFSSTRISLSSYNEFSYLQHQGVDPPQPDIISYR